MSNFVRNINSTYCSKGNMECLPSSCEKSLSKNCASLLNIELLQRTEPIGLLNPPQMRWWGYAGSSPTNHFWPNGCGNEVKVQPSLEPDSFPVSVAVLLLKKWQEVSICPHTPEKRRTLICRWLKQSCALIFFYVKNPKRAVQNSFKASPYVLRLLFCCFLKDKGWSGSDC